MSDLADLGWFWRRPCFWIALAAVGAVLAEWWLRLPLAAWMIVLIAGIGACCLRQLVPGALACVAALSGALLTVEIAPLAAIAMREGAAITVRGQIVRTFGGPERRRAALLQSDAMLTIDGWVKDREKIGVVLTQPLAPGDRCEISGRIELPRPARNPGGQDQRLLWLRRGAKRIIRPRPHGEVLLARGGLAGWNAASEWLRGRVLAANRASLPPRAALIANDFLLGDRDTPDPLLREDVDRSFRDSGTMHILVVSGTQVSLVLALFIWLGWRVWRLRYAFWLLGTFALGLYWLLTGGDASVSRAAVMGLSVIGALALNREADGENCLGIAALALLASSRFAVFDAGAQLSFLAVWSLIRLAPPIARAIGPGPLPDPDADPKRSPWTRHLHARAAEFLAASIAAHLAVAPVLAFHFQRSSWAGVLANIPMVFIAEFLMFAALMHSALALMGIGALGTVVTFFADGLNGWAQFFAGHPFGAGFVFPPPAWLLPIVIAGSAVPSLMRSRSAVLAFTLLIAAAVFLSERLPTRPPAAPTLQALDIGQGDAILLRSTDGRVWLVDAGPPESARRDLLPALRALRIAKIDAMVATHADLDHIGGAEAVMREMRVGMFVHAISDPPPESALAWNRVLRTAALRGVRVERVADCPVIQIGNSSLHVLGPTAADQMHPLSHNEGSLVARWDCQGARVMLTGDAGAASESKLARWGSELQSDVLKVGHHGSATATTEAWLGLVRPKVAVISCGLNNGYGHPAPETVARIAGAGTRAIRTDQSGMVTVTIDGRRIEADGYLAPDGP